MKDTYNKNKLYLLNTTQAHTESVAYRVTAQITKIDKSIWYEYSN